MTFRKDIRVISDCLHQWVHVTIDRFGRAFLFISNGCIWHKNTTRGQLCRLRCAGPATRKPPEACVGGLTRRVDVHVHTCQANCIRFTCVTSILSEMRTRVFCSHFDQHERCWCMGSLLADWGRHFNWSAVYGNRFPHIPVPSRLTWPSYGLHSRQQDRDTAARLGSISSNFRNLFWTKSVDSGTRWCNHPLMSSWRPWCNYQAGTLSPLLGHCNSFADLVGFSSITWLFITRAERPAGEWLLGTGCWKTQ